MTRPPILLRTWLWMRVFLALWFMSHILHFERASAQANIYKSGEDWAGDSACESYFEGHSVRFHAYQAPRTSGADGETNYFAPSLEDSNCTHLPATGPAIFTVDLMDRKLRETPVSFKIIDPMADGPSRLVVHQPAQVYPRGIIETYPNFARPGQYRAILSYSDRSLPEQQLTLFVAESQSLVRLRDLLGVLLIAIAGTLATGEVARWLQKDK